jgi:hypothetical protein
VCLVQNAVRTPRPTTFMYAPPRNALYTHSYHGGNYTLIKFPLPDIWRDLNHKRLI